MTDSPPDFLLVSWTALFSLDIADSDADLWYSLSILTPTSGSLLPFPCPDCHYITDTFYNLSVSGLTQGVYEIQVMSVNAYDISSQPSKIPLYVRMAPNTHDHPCGIHPNITTGNTRSLALLNHMQYVLPIIYSSVAPHPLNKAELRIFSHVCIYIQHYWGRGCGNETTV